MSKRCYKCRKTKPIEDFNKNRAKVDGYADECRECNRQKMYEWNRNNQDYIKQHRKEYYSKTWEHQKEKSYEWRRKNHERFLEYVRQNHRKHSAERVRAKQEWRARRREELRRSEIECHKKWLATHPANRKAYSNNRRARTLAGGAFTAGEWIALQQQYGNKCLRCSNTGVLVADHVIPLARGGKNTIDNIQPLCKQCNLEKHAKTVDYRVTP